MTAPTPPEKAAAIREMHAKGFTTRQISRALSCSYQTIQKALNPDTVTSKFAAKVMPDDFASRAVAMTFSEAACAFGVSGTTVFNWASKCGIKFVNAVRPVPDDFEARYRVTVKRELEVHYQASYSTVKRWGSKMPADARAEHDAFVRAAIGDGARERWAVVNVARLRTAILSPIPFPLAPSGVPLGRKGFSLWPGDLASCPCHPRRAAA